MVDLPVDARLKIERMIEDAVVHEERRGYLGLSQIGKDCPRALWYDFRFCSEEKFSTRIARLFQRGHREEPIIVADLKRIGVVIHSDQAEVVCGYGHIKGHIDGVAEGIPDAPKMTHLLEFKTMSEKYFNQLKKKNLREANLVYWAQCQCYMRLMKLTRTLFIAVNKNTDKRYYERIPLDKERADYYLKRGQDIILSEVPPPKFESFKCVWCSHKGVCQEHQEPLRNCRTCQYCDMENKGRWSCSKKGDDLKKHWLKLTNQIAGCADWRKLSALEI